MICGIVLAAGRSRRMGEPKALLRRETRPFCSAPSMRCAKAAARTWWSSPRGWTTRRRGGIAEEAAELDAGIAVNPAAESEQVDSLRIGLASLPPEARGGRGRAGGRPRRLRRARTCGDRRVSPHRRAGRPPRAQRTARAPGALRPPRLRELARPELPQGARTVIHAYAAELAEVPVEALPADVDTPDEYRRWRAARVI